MHGIKIPLQDFAQKNVRGVFCARGGAYLRNTMGRTVKELPYVDIQ